MKKKLIALLLCVVLVVAAVCVLVACETEDYDYEITVWVGEGMKDLTAQQIKTFNENNEDGIKFKATIEIQSESNAVGAMEGKPANSWPDIFCFAQDTLARAVNGAMLHPLNDRSKQAIENNNTETAVTAAKIGTLLRAFPMTADNGYFMYYDKSVIGEDHLENLEDLIADCKAAGKKFSMNLSNTGGAWYAASFFYATDKDGNSLCKSEWPTNNDGKFTDQYADTFYSDNGVIALQGIQKLLKETNVHQDNDSAEDFTAGVPSAVVISGIWDYNTASKALKENLGIAPLPKFTVDGEKYQLVSYLGHKFMGVKPQTDAYRAAYLQKLATYLTSAECQQARFDLSGWGPSSKTLTNVTSTALTALKTTATVMQGQYPVGWWGEVVQVTSTIKDNIVNKNVIDDAASLKIMLGTYNQKIAALVNA